MNLTNAELTVLKDFLDQLSDHFSCAGCNDYTLKNTPENRDLLIDAVSYFHDDVSGQELEEMIETIDTAKEKKLYTNNITLLAYLQYKLFGDK